MCKSMTGRCVTAPTRKAGFTCGTHLLTLSARRSQQHHQRPSASVSVSAGSLVTMNPGYNALILFLLLGPGSVTEMSAAAEYSSKTDLDYEYGDYRGKWCLDDHGVVYSIGEVYYPGSKACPCTCTNDGPVCVRPKCPHIHPRCTRISYKGCCPVCQAIAKGCVFRGKMYHVGEFRASACEFCRCEVNGQVYCTIADCAAPHCVDPVYEPDRCCPICKDGPNCFAGNRVIPAGVRVKINERMVCYCTYQEGAWYMWHAQTQATCEERPQTPPPPTTPGADAKPSMDEDTGGKGRRGFNPKFNVIP